MFKALSNILGHQVSHQPLNISVHQNWTNLHTYKIALKYYTLEVPNVFLHPRILD